MKLNTSDWHFRVYAWTFTVYGKNVPEPKDRCDYLRQILLAPVHLAFIGLCAVIFFGLMMAVTPIYWSLSAVILILGGVPKKGLWGEYADMWKIENDGYWSYRRYHVKKIKGIPLHPWVFIYAGFTVYMTVQGGILLPAIAISLFIGRTKIKGWLISGVQYFRSHKGSLCPMIQVNDDTDMFSTLSMR